MTKFRKVITEPIQVEDNGVNIAGGIHAAIAANVNESDASHVTSKQRVKIVQRNGRTEVFEHSHDQAFEEEDADHDTGSSRGGEDA